MFRFYFTAAYLIPSIYSYLRIRRLLPKKTHREVFSLFFLVLLLIYPITSFLSHSKLAPDITGLLNLGYMVMPYLLYLFIAVLAIDIILLAAYLLRILPSMSFKSYRARNTFLLVALLVPLATVIEGIINHNTLRIKGYDIEVPAKKSKLDSLRIAFAADFHIEGPEDEGVVREFTRKTKAQKPDIVLLGGDIFENDRSDIDLSFLKKYFLSIDAQYGIYTVFGNHEYHADYDMKELFEKLGIKVLLDEVIAFEDAFYLIGRSDKRSRKRKELSELLCSVKRQLPVILLDHRPEELKDLKNRDIDIMFSGHTHRGQLFPFNFIVKWIYGHSYGHKRIGNANVFVTSGVQTWGPGVRTVGTSQIMMIDVAFKR